MHAVSAQLAKIIAPRSLIFVKAAAIAGLVLGLAACGGGGGGYAGAPAGASPPPPAAAAVKVARFAYVANYNNNTLSMYAVDAATGQFHYTGYIAAGTAPVSVTVDPSGKFAYAANFNSKNISVYTIDPTTGALTAGTAVAAGSNPTPSPPAAGCSRAGRKSVRKNRRLAPPFFVLVSTSIRNGI